MKRILMLTLVSLGVLFARAASLPAGYQAVAYIESTGSQYINPNLTVGNSTSLDLKLTTSTQTSGNYAFFGRGWGNNEYLMTFQSGSFKFYGDSSAICAIAANTDYTVTASNTTVAVLKESTQVRNSITGKTFGGGSGWNIFAASGGGNKSSYKLRSMNIWEAGVLVRDFHPCYTNTANGEVIGLYDTVTAKFYVNAGSGAFLRGQETENYLWVTGTPGEYGTPICGSLTGYGDRPLTPGTVVTASVPVVTGETATVKYELAGWKLTVRHGDGTSTVTENDAEHVAECTFTPAEGDLVTLEWQWSHQYRIGITAGAGGTVSTTGGWYTPGDTLNVTATPSTSHAFYQWTGDVPSGQEQSATLSLAADQPRALAAHFVALGSRYIDITPSGYAGSAPLTNFPLLVRLSTAITGFNYTMCQPDGADLFFTDADRTLLPHEIDTWDTSGTSLVWVRVPELTKTTALRLYISAPDAIPPAFTTNGAVWADGYRAVWHMDDGTGDTNILDSTANRFGGVKTGAGSPAETDAVVGKGQLFASNYINLTGLKDTSTTHTVTMWVKGSTWEGTRYLFDVESGRFAFAWSSDGYAGQIGFYQTAWGLFGATPSLDVWHHIALCCGADARLYVDGVPYGSTKTYTGVVFGGAAALGSRNTTYLYSFAGLLDEVRVSSVLRSPDWVAASYSNMVPDSAFIAYNPVMPTPGPSLQIVSRPPGYGVANPVYGVHEGLEEGHTYTCSVSRVWDDADGYRYRCTGWKRYDIDRVTFEESPLGEEATNELVYTHGDLERLEWYFAPQSVRLTTSASAGGSVEVSPASDDGYYAIGAIVTNTATPAEGYTFAYWSDDVPAGVTATDPTITFAVDKPRKITAVFGDPVPPIFLKSDATGDGSGKTWKNACTNLSQAVAAAAAHTNRIFAAGGVYINAVTATDNRATVFDGFEIYGGFPGLSETEQISDRDIDRYPTIFTIDKGLDDTWHHYVPDPNSYTAPTAVDSGELVIRDGKINFPAYTAQYDVYLPTAARGNLGSSSVGITVPAKAHALIDGLWFHNAGQTVYLADTAKQSTIRNCRFIGGNSGNGVVFDRMGSSSEEGRIEGCRFYGFTNGGVWSFGHTTLINDAFESFYMPGVEHHAAIYFWTGGNHFVSDCTFARGLGYNSNRGGAYDGGAIFIGREQYDCAPVYRCVFTNSLLASTHTAGRSFLSIGGVSVTDCRFEHLRLLCKPTTDGTYALTQFDTWHDNWFVDFNRCVFAHNVVAAPATSLTGASYGLGIVGHTTGNFRYSLEDCTFVSNRFEHADAAGGNVVCADVLTRAAASGANSQIGLANCTFLEDGSAPVVAQYGTGHTKTLAIVNTIVSGPESAYQPFSFVNPGLVSLLNGSIDAFAQLPDGLASTNGLQRDRVPLQAVAGPLGSTVYRPYARMPGLLDSCDVSTNSTSYLYQSYRYRAPGATTWTALTPTIAAVSQSTTFGPIPDAVQEPRFYGAFARGAVQTVADGTNGCVLVVRMEPLGAGRITATGLEDARAYAQTFPKGTAPAPITATGLRGATFLGWYTTNGVLLSANATYAPEALSDDTILVATFDPARVTITFAIKGGDARFETNLSDTVSLQCGIGTAFPSVPAYEYSTEDYIFEGWDKPFPVYVPAVDTAYTATLFTKSVRIIHVVPAAEMPAGSDGSGSSWANASTNFSAAYADAGHYRGEVWVKQGRYHVGNILPLPNVTLRGGFAGTETDAAQADPSAHKTVFSGDASENNYWNTGAKPKIWQDGVFTMPSIAWPPTGNNTDDIAYFFTAADNVTNCAVDGVTFTCFKSSVFQELSFSTDVSLSRCDLLANNTGAAGTVVLTKGLLALRDCRFIGSPSMVNFSGSSTGTNVIEDCLFAYSYHGNNGMIRNTATTRLDIRRTTFTHYRDYSWSSHHAAVLDYNNGSGTVEDCVFANHRCSTSSMGPVRIGQAGTAPLVEFIRCTFTNNVHDTGDNQSSHAACVRIINLSSCTFRDCRFAGNTTTVSTTEARYLASAVMVDAGYAQFINTTFEDNVVDAPAATTASSLACVRTTGTSSSAAFVNCAFRNNGTFVAINTPHADIGSYGTGTLGVFNTIFDAGGVISYLAIRENSSVPTMVASCVIDGPEPQFAAGGIYTNVWYGKAPLHDRLAEKDGYPAQLMVASSSPYARRGTPVWAAPNANLYRYYWYDAATDPAKPWRRTLVKSETAASVPGLSLASVPVPDAFGQIRRIRRTPIGPVNPEDSGTLLLLR